MKIIKCLNAILIIALVQISPCVYAGELSIELSERLQYAHNEEYISAIVRMADQADLKIATKGIVGRNKALRSRNVIRKLQSTAKARQEDLIAFLEKEKSLGNVLSYTSFWIFNGLSIKATPAVIEKIASREDVEIINLDVPISLPDPIQTTPPETVTLQADSPYTWNIKKINAPEVWEMGLMEVVWWWECLIQVLMLPIPISQTNIEVEIIVGLIPLENMINQLTLSRTI